MSEATAKEMLGSHPAYGLIIADDVGNRRERLRVRGYDGRNPSSQDLFDLLALDVLAKDSASAPTFSSSCTRVSFRAVVPQ